MRPITLLVAAIVLIAAACGSDTSETTTTTAPATTTTAAATTTTAAPATTAATTSTEGTAAEPIVPGEDPDVDAVVEAYVLVFDSTTTYEEKVPYLVEPDGLEETVAAYTTTGEQFSGVSVQPDAVTIDGDTATITYTLLFGGAPAYSDLTGEAELTEAGWQISRDTFCTLMQQARVGCP